MISYKEPSTAGIVNASNSLVNSMYKKQKLIDSSLDSIVKNGTKLFSQESNRVDAINRNRKQRNTEDAIASIKSASNQKQLSDLMNQVQGTNLINKNKINNYIGEQRNLIMKRDNKLAETNLGINKFNIEQDRIALQDFNNRQSYLANIANKNKKLIYDNENNKVDVYTADGKLLHLNKNQAASVKKQEEHFRLSELGSEMFKEQTGRYPRTKAEIQQSYNFGKNIERKQKRLEDLQQKRDEQEIKNPFYRQKAEGELNLQNRLGVAFPNSTPAEITAAIEKSRNIFGLFQNENNLYTDAAKILLKNK